MVGQIQNMSDIMMRYENSALNKTDAEINAAKIKLFEKKKISYRIIVNEAHNYDKKIVKRNKKMITNNKYILFNSWYTKNRKSYWLSSHDMWNYMKNHSSCKNFIDIFDYMEKLGKSVKIERRAVEDSQQQQQQHSDTSCEDETDGNNQKTSSNCLRKKKHDINLEEIKEGNDKRLKLYDEFYKVLTVTFKTDNSPTTSCIYDAKFTRAFIENGVNAFKIVIHKLDQERERENENVNNNNIATAKSRKRKRTNSGSNHVKSQQRHNKIQKRNNTEEFTMINDHFEDSQMSE
ncbi:39K protein [Artaxa digramma nucleopolyhedrovirus]|uniref:39K protein n=1 Tax=Artaxa digramma nucleopolyhedrovirus TaxID=3070910 RepID=A0AAE6R7R8_9ABAC|nr:39K protein [Euproctis digramma nucleopolyhedrovirus]QHB21707.1 39K protein [Artaxa digramma nucleopolyhedrovirus]